MAGALIEGADGERLTPRAVVVNPVHVQRLEIQYHSPEDPADPAPIGFAG
jgi:hypothetical protein